MHKLLSTLVLLLALLDAARGAVSEVRAIGLTVANLPRALEFYTNVLACEVTGRSEIDGAAYSTWFGLPPGRAKVAELKLGDERITLTEACPERPERAARFAQPRSLVSTHRDCRQ